MDRKQQLINQLETAIKEVEQWLIDTPPGTTDKQYQAWIEKLKEYQKMLQLVQGM